MACDSICNAISFCTFWTQAHSKRSNALPPLDTHNINPTPIRRDLNDHHSQYDPHKKPSIFVPTASHPLPNRHHKSQLMLLSTANLQKDSLRIFAIEHLTISPSPSHATNTIQHNASDPTQPNRSD
eukprot:1139004_1